MRNTWYLLVTCDGCGQQVKVDSWSSDQVTAWKQPSPAGWWNGHDPMAWALSDPFGMRIMDLCPGCCALPLIRLIERIVQRSEKVASANGQ